MTPGSEDLPMLDVYLPMMKSAALISAGEIGLFQTLAASPQDAASLAAATGTSEAGISRLAHFLVSLGYLEIDGERLANSAHTARWFTADGEIDFSAGLRWTAVAWGLMADLTNAVRQGRPATILWESMQRRPEVGQLFSRYMEALAQSLIPDLLAHVRLPQTARRLLDLGGSHGAHAIAFCREYPELQAVIVDHGCAMADTTRRLDEAGVTERVRLCAGDLRQEPWGEGYDAVLLLSVMHNQTAADNAHTLTRIAQALRPGGLLAIHEYPLDTPPSPLEAAMRLTLLTETGTTTYSEESIAGWLSEAGFLPPQRIELSARSRGSLFLARTPGSLPR